MIFVDHFFYFQLVEESIRHFNSRGEVELEIPEEDFEAMEDLIDHWEDLKAVALDQQGQAKQVQVSTKE